MGGRLYQAITRVADVISRQMSYRATLLDDTNNWYLVAKPSSIATIEIGFLRGMQLPQVFMKEDFDREVIWYKGRLVFGGAVLDYRGFYGAIVS